jgi:FkbM family methyltransferase
VDSIETRYGPFRVPVVDQDLIISFLRRYGEWAHSEARFVAANLPQGPVRVLDVGAFLGTFGLGLATEHEIRSLVMVEANNKVMPSLRENARQNARIPSVVINALVAPEGVALTGSYEENNLGSLAFATTDAVGRKAAALPACRMTLTDIRREHGDFDLIKMDVEGLELPILWADPDVLRPGGSVLWLECNEAEASLDLADFLLKNGLSVHYFAFPSFAPDNYRGDPEALLPFAYESGLWATHGPAPSLPSILAQMGCILCPILSREDLRRALWVTPRWGRPEWKGAPASTLIAEAAHALSGQDYSLFLAAADTSVDHRGAALEELRRAKVLLEAERGQRITAERELRAARFVLDDLNTRAIRAEDQFRAQGDIAAVQTALAAHWRDRASAYEQVVAEIHRRSQLTLAQRAKASAVARLKAFFGRHPALRELARPAATLVRRIRARA